MSEFEFGGDIAWRPTREQIVQSNLYQAFTRDGFASLDDFMRAATNDIAWFWDTMLRELDVRFYEPYTQVVDVSGGIQFPKWCVGGKMNVVHNCLDKYIGTAKASQLAIKWEGEEGAMRTLTYAQLYREVNQIAHGLRALGLTKGDAIGVFMPMTPEIAIAVLAIAKIGAVLVPLFSGFGAGAAAARLNDAGAKALFTADGTIRRGQIVPLKHTADEAVRQAANVEHVIVLPRAKNRVEMIQGRDYWWDEIITLGSSPLPLGEGLGARGAGETEKTDAEDLLMLIYTSGTTGKPKGAVHTHCGFPVKSAQDMYHGLDVKPSDTLFWMTDMGWMMGPWQVYGTLLLGATMFLYDGAPDYPAPNRVWAMVERHDISLLGLSPTFVRAIMKYGDEPPKKYSLESLRAFGSTGEPWNPTAWLWLFNTVGEGKRPIINYSGGTEIAGGILMGNFLTAQKPGSFAGPLPGMDAEVMDEQGNPVRGRVGELVIRQPWIGMTRGFWKDPQRYLDTYWARFPNMWVHGDWAAVDDDGLWYILGRSDDVIKVAGKRLGPAEVESAIARHPAVQECAAIGVPDEIKGEAIVCFVILKAGDEGNRETGKQGNGEMGEQGNGEIGKRGNGETGKRGNGGTGKRGNREMGEQGNREMGEQGNREIEQELRELLVDELGKALAPKAIYFVNDLPRTRNAKIMRRVARAVYLGANPGDVSALENPRALEEIRKIKE